MHSITQQNDYNYHHETFRVEGSIDFNSVRLVAAPCIEIRASCVISGNTLNCNGLAYSLFVGLLSTGGVKNDTQIRPLGPFPSLYFTHSDGCGRLGRMRHEINK